MSDPVKALVRKFIDDNLITCPESVYQMDHVIENAYEFIVALCEQVGYFKEDDDGA